MKKHLQKSMMLAVLMIFGTVSSWALTANLSMDYELAGYKAKAFYDLTSNDAGVMPETGDLRFRSGYGLFDFGSGNRSADVSIPVTETDVLVCQFADTQSRSVTINSISGCTKSATLSDADGHLFFEVNTTATSLTINIGRGGCVVSILVMEKDASAATADYTLNYDYEGTTVKTVSATGAVGGTVLTDASFFVDDVKYFRKDGEPESFTIAASGNTFTVNVRLAATYSYTLTDNFGATVASGTGFEGENVSAPYSRYQLKDGVFYEAATTNKEYRKSITLSEDNAKATVEYTAKEGVNVVFFVEGENVSGMTATTTGNVPVRASNALAGVSEEDVTITTLAPGKYILHAGIFASKSSYAEKVVNFGIGENTFAPGFNAVNLNEVASEEYTLNAETPVTFIAEGTWADAQFDYIWIEKTGDVEVVPVATKTIGLVPGVWAADEATFAAYAWNAEGNAWFPFVEVSGAYVTQIPENYTGINIVRLKPATAEGFNTDNYGLNWDNKWNQTGNIDFTTVADNSLITITGWDTYEITIPVDIETAKAKLTEIIAQAKELNKYANDEALATAIENAEKAVAGDDATAIASAAVDLETTATAAAKNVLGNAITLAGTFGIDASAAQAVLNDEDASAEDLANALKEFVNTAIPAAKDALAQAKSFFNTFDKTAAEKLKGDFDAAEAALDGTDINAMITAAQTLMYDAMPAAEKALEKVFYYVELIDDATLNDDAAAIKAAMADNNLKGMIDAANQMKADFPNAVNRYIEKVDEIANTEAYGEKGVDELKAAINKAKSAIVTATINKDIVAMGEAIRNLVLAVEAYKEANITYTVVGGFDDEGDIDNIIFGKQWNPSLTDNDMEKQADGTWTKVYENITLDANTTIFYKVVKNHSWDENWGFEGNNADYIVNEAGKYNIYFLFNPTSLLDNGYNVSCNVVDATTDGISSVVAEAVKAGQAYNLSGQRVVKAKKGLYIIDGKKMVIR